MNRKATTLYLAGERQRAFGSVFLGGIRGVKIKFTNYKILPLVAGNF